MRSFEQRYGYLLRFYPKRYREERGAEILGVLAEGGRPGLRERGGLIIGGLRARLGTGNDRTVSGSWLSACYLAALTLLLAGVAGELLRSVAVPDAWVWAQAAASVVAFGLAWKRWYLPAALVAIAAVALDAIGRHGVSQLNEWEQPLAVLLLIPLIGRARPALPRWPSVLLLPFIVLLEFPLGSPWVPLLVALVLALLVATLDHRIGLAAALMGVLAVADAGWNMQSIYWAFPDMLGAMWLPTLVPVAVLAFGGVLARRRAQI